LIIIITGLISIVVLRALLKNYQTGSAPLRIDQIIAFMTNILFVSASVGSVVGLIFAYTIIRPIRALSSQMANIAQGAPTTTFRIESSAGNEIAALGEAFNRIVASMSEHLPEQAKYIFDNMASGVMAISSDGCISSVNTSAVTMFALEKESIIGKHINDVFKDLIQANSLI